MANPKLVVVTANIGPRSKSKLLADAIAERIRRRIAVDVANVEIGSLIADIGPVLFRSSLPPSAEAAVCQIEEADLLVVATPVYKGSYTGHFKHLFDLVAFDALTGVPVALAATGGGERHALVVEHQLRPLFGAFQAQSLPTGVYASDSDFEEDVLRNPAVLARVDVLAAEAASALQAWHGTPALFEVA